MKKAFTNWGAEILGIILLGLLLGILSKWLDLASSESYIEKIFLSAGAEISSRLNIWIVLAVWISVRSSKPGKAAVLVFSFFIAMLAGYYEYAEYTGGYYSASYVTGWTAAAVCSPIPAAVCWHMGKKSPFSLLLRLGTVGCMVISALCLGGSLYVPDLLLSLLMAGLLFFRRSPLFRKRPV